MAKIRYAWAKVSDFLDGGLFDPSYKMKMHYIQIGLVLLIICLTGARIATKPESMAVSRGDTLAIVMGIKTLLVLSYQLVTTKVEKCRRWQNLKLYQVLNTMEVLFWFVVVIINFMGIASYCQGAYCGLSWMCVLIAIVLTTFALWAAIVTRRLRQQTIYVERQSPAMY